MLDTVERFNSIYSEWRKFVRGGEVDRSIISALVLDAWERCKSKGVDPYLVSIPLVLEGKALDDLLETNSELIEISRPFMEHLYEFVKGSSFVVALADADGFLIQLVGDDHILQSIKQGQFVVGACWREEIAGSNGVGTVLALRKPLQICGCEHYCINSRRWTCSGAPIRNSEGHLVGVIDMTGHHELAHPHTLGMVVASATAIQNEYRFRKALAECQIADSFQRTVISSIPEIIIAIDTDGTISLMNNNAKKLFGSHPDGHPAMNINSLWQRNNSKLLDHINNNDSLTDIEVRIQFKNSFADFTLTCNPIVSMNKVIGKLIILNEIKRARTLATRMMGAQANFQFEDVIGNHPDFLATVELARIATQIDSNVLLLGESGTGKDIFAQAIHNGSRRSDGPYVAVNCVTIPRDLISSELFGYSDGAFTGSRKGGCPGKFELAEGGTIFLDEIGDAPLELQTALLRIIEDKSIIRVGGTRVTKINVRIIAATNRNLKEEVRKGTFREDLYYRLNAFTLQMIPLRKRKTDIPFLVDSFLRRISMSMGKEIIAVDNDVLEKFMQYHWPGNVRELQNVLERMMNIAPTNRLTSCLLPSEIVDERLSNDSDYATERIDSVERELVLRLLKSTLSKNEIAKKLGISRSTLYRKLEKYGHDR
ncbi:sigma-54-dependent Fis family transcriptional regulator [Desulfomonile tiedjei]|uniref:Transcriptional activator of acetoin/glycerol metabolism n=1 Tax=Desulfomonile tiedjei (strain ATCC 49306 / DSM 6799 / DCB-1) TaxID=706587 RepID=I4C1T6_DESTA|nr:sigma-54-dependent Fis family transcriptional regulator [Desulfomonile tiedjei]AFM23527.1 transcriptional activator of acetoin/glycerol metabolism [Desulfomonile tiedjei DSM 6799]